MASLIPEGWSTQTLDGKVHILSGFPFQSALFCDDSARMGIIRIRDLVKQSIETFYAGDFEEVYVVKKGDILIGMDGDFTIVKWNAKDALLNQRVCKVKAESDSGFDTNFLFHSLAEDLISINAATGATTVKHLSVKDIRGIEKVYPPLPEQQKIASILSSVDDVIEKTRAQIDKLKDLKTGMMQELLTKGIGHTEFKDSPVGRIPVAWKVKRLDDLSEKISDGLHSTPKYVDHSDYRFINGNNLKEGGIVFGERAKYVSEGEYSKHKKDLTSNTILMSINGTIGNLAFYNAEKVVLGKSAAYISLHEDQSKYFIYFVLQSQSVKQFYDLELTGSTINNLSLRSIKDTPIPIPPLAEQVRIASILSNIDTVVRQKLERVEQVNGLKKALMQDLLTGKVRVKLTDLDTEAVS